MLFGRHRSYYTKEGYKQVWAPKSSEARENGYAPKHRLVMSRKLGRPLGHDEIVHHKNGNKRDNRARNLQIMSRSAHYKVHHTKKKRFLIGNQAMVNNPQYNKK